MNIDPLAIVVCLGSLCVGGIAVGFVFQLLGGVVQIVGALVGVVLNVLSGGPIAWCGCGLLLLFGCGVVSLVGWLASALPQCGTLQAVNLCRLFGY